MSSKTEASATVSDSSACYFYCFTFLVFTYILPFLKIEPYTYISFYIIVSNEAVPLFLKHVFAPFFFQVLQTSSEDDHPMWTSDTSKRVLSGWKQQKHTEVGPVTWWDQDHDWWLDCQSKEGLRRRWRSERRKRLGWKHVEILGWCQAGVCV